MPAYDTRATRYAGASVQRRPTTLRLALLTLGDPNRLTGGYLYHHRLAEYAPRHDAEIGFVSLPDEPFVANLSSGYETLSLALDAGRDALAVDSIVAAALALPLAARKPSLPVIGVLHQPPGGVDHEHDLQRSTLQAALDRRFYAEATLLVVPSKPLAAAIRATGVPAERIRVIPPGKDIEPATDVPTPTLSRQSGPALLCVANWLPLKGIHILLDALALLPAGSGTLHLVGDSEADPSYGASLRERLRAEDLAGRVVVHGARPPAEVAAYYRAADIFVLPSAQESYGMVFAEAMTVGLPVIGGRTGNLLYLIEDEVDGLLIDPGDVPALANAIRRLAGDPELRRRLGRAAAERAASWPTWGETTGRFVAVVREAIGRFGDHAGDEEGPWRVNPSG